MPTNKKVNFTKNHVSLIIYATTFMGIKKHAIVPCSPADTNAVMLRRLHWPTQELALQLQPEGIHRRLWRRPVIAERTVSLHGGRISAANRPDGGLEVSILLLPSLPVREVANHIASYFVRQRTRRSLHHLAPRLRKVGSRWSLCV